MTLRQNNSPPQWKSEKQGQEHAHHFLWHQGIVNKEFALAGQTVNSAYYCEVKCAKTLPRTLVTKGLAVASQRTVSHFLLHQGISSQKQHDCYPPLTYFSLFPQLKTKLKGRHFYTDEVTKAESHPHRT
jgi:hypothetical protein